MIIYIPQNVNVNKNQIFQIINRNKLLFWSRLNGSHNNEPDWSFTYKSSNAILHHMNKTGFKSGLDRTQNITISYKRNPKIKKALLSKWGRLNPEELMLHNVYTNKQLIWINLTDCAFVTHLTQTSINSKAST